MENITDKEWYDPNGTENAIKTVEQLRKVIKLSDYQASEIERVIATLKAEGKDTLRITPYYAS